MQTIVPNSDQIFAKPIKAENKTKSGILLGDRSKEPAHTAEVINIGVNVRTCFNQKDIIVFKEYATTEIKMDDVTYILIAQDDVLGTVVDMEE